jgi:hypothetical protein
MSPSYLLTGISEMSADGRDFEEEFLKYDLGRVGISGAFKIRSRDLEMFLIAQRGRGGGRILMLSEGKSCRRGHKCISRFELI